MHREEIQIGEEGEGDMRNSIRLGWDFFGREPESCLLASI
jgi:hypothetical protein